MRALINLMLNLPWWGNLILLVVLAALFYFSGWWLRRRFEQITREAVLEVGAAMKDAEVTVHAVEARPMPSPHSPYDIKEDDEDFVDGVDNEPWDDKEKKTLTMTGEGPGMDGKPMKFKAVSVMPDDDTINFSMYMGDAPQAAFTIAYKRKK